MAWEKKGCQKKGQMWNTELENFVTAHFCNWKSGTPFPGRRACIFETFHWSVHFVYQPGLINMLNIDEITVNNQFDG